MLLDATQMNKEKREADAVVNFLHCDTNSATNCSDFRYESNGIFVLGVGFFFFRQISTF